MMNDLVMYKDEAVNIIKRYAEEILHNTKSICKSFDFRIEIADTERSIYRCTSIDEVNERMNLIMRKLNLYLNS